MKWALRLVSATTIMVVCFLLFVIGQLPLMEGYNPVNPSIDTWYTEKFDEAKFNTIGPGMDTARVIGLIGKPFSIQDMGDSTYIWYYTGDSKCKWGDFAWLGRELYVKEGRVVSRATPIHYD